MFGKLKRIVYEEKHRYDHIDFDPEIEDSIREEQEHILLNDFDNNERRIRVQSEPIDGYEISVIHV